LPALRDDGLGERAGMTRRQDAAMIHDARARRFDSVPMLDATP
jgi:hypothetical protein